VGDSASADSKLSLSLTRGELEDWRRVPVVAELEVRACDPVPVPTVLEEADRPLSRLVFSFFFLADRGDGVAAMAVPANTKQNSKMTESYTQPIITQIIINHHH
jgi:hypothetical protein